MTRTASVRTAAAALLLLAACHRSAPQIPANQPEGDNGKQAMLHYNQQRLQEETDSIRAFLDTVSDPFTETDDGFWLRIDRPGEGPAIEYGQAVRYAYSLERLDGTVAESTAGKPAARMEVGRRQTAKGLDLAMPLLSRGAEARVLLPSRLAFGPRGRDGIAGWTPVLYRIRIIDTE